MTSRLELQDLAGSSCKTLRIGDASSYNPDIPVENAVLEVTPPGFSCPIALAVQAGFNIVLNSSTLQIAPAITQADLINLPDGVYMYKYSIRPNDQLFVEYSVLRNCQLLQKFYLSVCELFDARPKVTRKEFEQRRKELIWIKELIDASKYMVEEAHQEHEGLEMYNEANRLLDRKNSCIC